MEAGLRGQHDGADARPIGVFDSGTGGLSILKALRAHLPCEDFVYFSDAAYAPYGERDEAHVVARSVAIADELVAQHGVKALVVACNTATAAAIAALRDAHPALCVIGVEPAIKPAVALSRTGHIAVLATRGTLHSRKYEALLASLHGQAMFHPVACDGLAAAIERADAPELIALCARYMGAAGTFGSEVGQIDAVVLGCTHYPFVLPELVRHAASDTQFLEPGAPVARQLARRLEAASQLQAAGAGSIGLIGTGDLQLLASAAARWLAASSEPVAFSVETAASPAPALARQPTVVPSNAVAP